MPSPSPSHQLPYLQLIQNWYPLYSYHPLTLQLVHITVSPLLAPQNTIHLKCYGRFNSSPTTLQYGGVRENKELVLCAEPGNNLHYNFFQTFY